MKNYVLYGTALMVGMTGAVAAMANETAASAPASAASPIQGVTFVDPLGSSVIGQLGRDLSPVGMFQTADAVVQAVIVLLLVASLITWVIGVAKGIQLQGERRRLAGALRRVMVADNLEGVGETGYAPISDMVVQAEDEIAASRRSGMSPAAEGIKERISIRLDRLGASLRRDAGRTVGVLGIVSSTAPFVGLFGTVWGIMNSFIGIAHAQSTSLAVVAPGIAEALLTTAMGLVAAIPAAILYNVFSRVLSNYGGELGDASVAILCIAGREIDQSSGKV